MAIDGKSREVFDLLLAAGADVERSAEYADLVAVDPARDTFEICSRRAPRRTADRCAQRRCAHALLAKLRAGNGLDETRAQRLDGLLATLMPSTILALGVDRRNASPPSMHEARPDAPPGISGTPREPAEFARLGDRETLALARRAAEIARDDEVFMAAIDANSDLVEWLLDKGANPNARTGYGSQAMALHGADWQGNLRMAQLLVAAGADVHGRDVEHRTRLSGYARVSLKITRTAACIAVAEHLEALRERCCSANVAEAVGVAIVARVHARPARELALQRLELTRDLQRGDARRDVPTKFFANQTLICSASDSAQRARARCARLRSRPSGWRASPPTSPPGRTARADRRGRCSSHRCRSTRAPAQWRALHRGSSCGLRRRAREILRSRAR